MTRTTKKSDFEGTQDASKSLKTFARRLRTEKKHNIEVTVGDATMKYLEDLGGASPTTRMASIVNEWVSLHAAARKKRSSA